ncbi:MAG: hypothetical protein HAW60_04210 [Bdellovibrionales bacterium]|nr:hypothetical protein [Bdellovibrionales bacterium]
MFIKFFIALLIIFNPSVSFSYDGFKANNLLINKLTNLKDTLSKKNPSWVGVNLRLADLLFEQSRLCVSKNCKASTILNFRKRSINLYKKTLSLIPKNSRLNVYSQMGHLLQLSNKNIMAIKLYKKAIKLKGKTEDILAIKMSLAQAYFKLGSYKKSIIYYNQVLKNPNFNKYNLAVHKKSWALFRLNNVKQAIKILEKLIAQNNKQKTLGLVKVNPYFYSELLKDLVLFYSYSSKKPLKKAKKLLTWSPKKDQVKFLVFFAQELERLGHLASSIKLWNFNLDYLNNNKDRILAYQHITQAYYKSFLFAKASSSFSALTDECKKNFKECKSNEVALKNLLVDWFSTKKNRSMLLKNCSLFISMFPNNGDILVLSSQLGVLLKKWPLAINFYKQIEVGLKNKTVVFKDKKLLAMSVENFLWMQIETAELSKNPKLLSETYNYFIKNSKDKNKIFKIQYQKFSSLYEKKQHKNIIKNLPQIITSYTHGDNLNKTVKTKINSVAIRAINLVLQSLVKLKKDKEIEAWISQYKDYSFAKTASWKSYKKQAVLNQISNLSKSGQNKVAYNKLIAMPLNNLNTKEKINYYYNQLSLLEKLQKKDQEANVISKLLKLKKHIPPNKYNSLILRKVWLSELKLDFKTSFKYLKKIVNKNTSADRYLRLILFAELSGTPLAFNNKYYAQFFKKEKDLNKKQALALKLLKKNNFHLKVFNKYKKHLLKKYYQSSSLKVLNQLSFNLKSIHKGFLYKIIKSKKHIKNSDFIFVSRFYHLDKIYNPWLKSITKHKIKTKTQYQISKSLKRRLYWISKGEKLLKLSINKKDSVLQMFYAKTLSKESSRLYDNILNLPLPKGLSPEESELYSKALKEKAEVYKSKQEYYNKYYSEFWSNSKLLSLLKKQSELNLNNSFLLSVFLNKLKQVAPKNLTINIVDLQSILNKQSKKQLNNRSISNVSKPIAISDSELTEKVKQFPKNTEYLKALIKEEETLGNKSMMAYLNSRLVSLNGETNINKTTKQTSE